MNVNPDRDLKKMTRSSYRMTQNNCKRHKTIEKTQRIIKQTPERTRAKMQDDFRKWLHKHATTKLYKDVKLEKKLQSKDRTRTAAEDNRKQRDTRSHCDRIHWSSKAWPLTGEVNNCTCQQCSSLHYGTCSGAGNIMCQEKSRKNGSMRNEWEANRFLGDSGSVSTKGGPRKRFIKKGVITVGCVCGCRPVRVPMLQCDVTTYPSTAAEHVHPFMDTVFLLMSCSLVHPATK